MKHEYTNLKRGGYSMKGSIVIILAFFMALTSFGQSTSNGVSQVQQGFCPTNNDITFAMPWAENFGLGGALTWTITKDGESEPEYTGQYGYYTYNVPQYTEDFFQGYCLEGGCYTIAFSEGGFGDEITADAPLTITNGGGTNLVEPLTGDLDGYSFQYCTSNSGCTDETACNYDAAATESDNTLCTYPEAGQDCDGNCVIEGTFLYVDFYDCDQYTPFEVTEENSPGALASFEFILDGNGGVIINEYVGGQGFIQQTTTYTYDNCVLNIQGFGDFEPQLDGSFLATTENPDICRSLIEGTIGCIDPNACNYDPSAYSAAGQFAPGGLCQYPDPGYDCDGVCQVALDPVGTWDQYALTSVSGGTEPNSIAVGMGDLMASSVLTLNSDGLLSSTIFGTASSWTQDCGLISLDSFTEGQFLFVVNDDMGLLYQGWNEQEEFVEFLLVPGESVVTGCTDESACNYDADATQDDDSCLYAEGDFSFDCPADVELPIDQEENSIAYNYELPTLSGSCEELNFGMSSIDGFFEQNVPNYLELLGNTYNFNYDGNNDISDGGQDMYDGGNRLWTNISGTNIEYTEGFVTANTDFGTNGRYLTSEQTGMFLLAADLDGIESFQTTGNLGADGSGTANGFELSSGGFEGFYKQVCSAGDPSINQLIILDASVGANQTYSNNTNEGEHSVNGLSSATRMIYLLWAGNSGYCYSEEEVQGLLDEAIELMDLIVDGNAELISGFYPGGAFPLGTTTVEYVFTDEEEETHPCSFEVSVVYPNMGCNDSSACNFDPEAIQNDGSCEYPDFGFDCNGDCLGDAVSAADLMNQSYWGISFVDCFSGEGEIIPEAISFNSNGNLDLFLLDEFGNLSPNTEAPLDLEYEVFGNCLVGIDNMPGLYLDGSLIVEGKGCLEFFPISEGCKNDEACNYDPESVINNEDLCDYDCYGCTDESACNFNAEATLSDPEMCEYTFDFELVEFLEGEEPLFVGENNLLGADPLGMVFIYEADTDELVTNFSFSLIEEDVHFYTCLSDGCYYMTFDYPEEYEGLEFDMDYGEDTDEDLDGSLNDEQYYFTFGETDCIGGCFDAEADNYNPNATFDNEQCLYNDNCGSAIELTLNDEPVVGTNVGATGPWAEDNCLEVDEDGADLVNSVWYSLTVPHGPFVVRTILDGTMNDSSMDVYLNCSLNSIVDCNDDDDDLESALYFECDDLETGSTIYIRVEGYDDSVGSFSIVAESLEWEEDLEGCTNPMADNYEACANLDDDSCIITGCTDQSACNFNVLANNAGECDYDSCAGCTDPMACNYDEEAIIFDFELCNYSFVFESGEDFIPLGQPGQEELGFATIYSLDGTFVSEFPVYFDIYNLQGRCIEPGCYFVEFELPNGFNNNFTISLEGGESISAEFNDQERFYFSFGTEPCPAGCMDEQADNYDFFAVLDDGSCIYNDFCISAEELMVDGGALSGDNTNAGGSLNEADCFDDDEVVNSVWYSLEVPEGAFLIRTVLEGSMDDSMIEVYESCSDTESIACNDDEDDLESQVEFDCGELVPGEWIYIRVDGYDESTGSFFILAESIEDENEGCTDETAANYNACANIDDGSCEFEGCTDETAANYDEDATIDDGSCTFEGCTDETAANYNENASIDDGSCQYEGCTDETALNYNENATIDDGSCEYNCFEPTVLYDINGCNDDETGFSINLGVLNTAISGPFIISNNINGDELLVTEDGDYTYGNFDEDEDVVIILTSTITPNCFVSSSILACPLNLNEEEEELAWNLYPNPASTILNVSLDATSIEVVNIYDARGRLVESHQVNQSLMSINTSNWASGMYHVQVLGNDFVATKTVIVHP